MAAGAAVAQAVGLPWHSERTVELALDKLAMRARLAETGLDDTPHRRVSSARELAEFAREVGTAVVLKPSRGTGGVVRHLPAPSLIDSADVAVDSTSNEVTAFRLLLDRLELTVLWRPPTHCTANGEHANFLVTAGRSRSPRVRGRRPHEQDPR